MFIIIFFVFDKKIHKFIKGIESSIRPEVWKFLLGYYPFNSTEKERGKIREQKKYYFYLFCFIFILFQK